MAFLDLLKANKRGGGVILKMGGMTSALQLMKTYLSSAPDTDWVRVACETNYDGNRNLLAWMTKQPHCPAAAALAIYWYLQPGFYEQFADEAEVPRWAHANYTLLGQIRTRYLAGFYTPGTAGFDPRNDTMGAPEGPGHDWVAEDDRATTIPEALKTAVPGTLYIRGNDWDDGMPPEIARMVMEG